VEFGPALAEDVGIVRPAASICGLVAGMSVAFSAIRFASASCAIRFTAKHL
jgi:hypothetical protein